MGERDQESVKREEQSGNRRYLVFLPADARLNFDIKEGDVPQTEYNDRSVDCGRDNVANIVRGTYGRNREQQLEHISSSSPGL